MGRGRESTRRRSLGDSAGRVIDFTAAGTGGAQVTADADGIHLDVLLRRQRRSLHGINATGRVLTVGEQYQTREAAGRSRSRRWQAPENTDAASSPANPS